MFKWPWSKQTQVVVAEAPVKFYRAPDERRIRMGMWVKTDTGAIGIVTGLGDNLIEVTMTTGSGETVMITENNRVVPKREWFTDPQIKQAAYSDIPEPRRPTRESAILFGYGDK